MTQTVIVPTWAGELSEEKKLDMIDDVRWRILPDARAAHAESIAIVNCALQDREALAEANYLNHLLTTLLLVLNVEESNLG